MLFLVLLVLPRTCLGDKIYTLVVFLVAGFFLLIFFCFLVFSFWVGGFLPVLAYHIPGFLFYLDLEFDSFTFYFIIWPEYGLITVYIFFSHHDQLDMISGLLPHHLFIFTHFPFISLERLKLPCHS